MSDKPQSEDIILVTPILSSLDQIKSKSEVEVADSSSLLIVNKLERVSSNIDIEQIVVPANVDDPLYRSKSTVFQIRK